jgi:hypothetical protein
MRVIVKEIEELLKRIFHGAKKFASGTGSRAGYALVQHGTGAVAKAAVRGLRITLKDGTILSYEHLSRDEQEFVDEVVQYAVRFCHQYADHHDDHTKYRMGHHDIDEIIADHALEIYEAAFAAAEQRLRSHAYDAALGRPPRNPIFNDVTIKQLILGAIMEAWNELSTRQQPPVRKW